MTPSFAEANGLRFAYLASGPADGPLALCVHGFPDSPYTWRHLTPVLAQAGYRVVAPWQRGYAPTAIPADGQYAAGPRGADVNGLHAALGGDERAVLIGHDYGASSAYGAAASEPYRWSKIVTLAVPPPVSMVTKRTRYDQLKRFWYTFFFQRPNAPAVVAADDYAFIERLWRDWSPGYDPADDLPHVKRALAGPHLVAALSYYRALYGAIPLDPRYAEEEAAAAEPPPQPTLYLHGVDDGCIGIDLMDDIEAFLPGPGSRVERIADTGHFLHLEAPERINRIIAGFLAG
jgi:pimeloyl-ACP methyl ester carboxylesterase